MTDEDTQEPAHQVRDEEYSGQCGSTIFTESHTAVYSVGEHKTTKHPLATNVQDEEQETEKQQNGAVSDPAACTGSRGH